MAEESPVSRVGPVLDLDSLRKGVGSWLRAQGPESDIVISSRVRLARNVAGFPFLVTADARTRKRIEKHVRDRILASDLGEEVTYFPLRPLSQVDRQFLVERHLISRDHAFGQGPRGVALGPDEALSIMVNEEDHLRIQVLRSGLELMAAWREANRIDDILEKRIDYAFSSQFGYLTACPTNVGTGLRISVMLHLPALVMTRQIDKVFQAVSKINLAVRGLHGEGTQASGDFYQISNQVTLGKSEEEIVENLGSVIPQIIKYERTVRETLLEVKRQVLEDKVWRALGMLTYARLIASEEAMDLLSAVRLGVNLGLIRTVDVATVNELFVFTQPAHLQKIEGARLNSPERDAARAAFIRNRLSAR